MQCEPVSWAQITSNSGSREFRKPLKDLLTISVRFPGLGSIIYAKIFPVLHKTARRRKNRCKEREMKGEMRCFVIGSTGFVRRSRWMESQQVSLHAR